MSRFLSKIDVRTIAAAVAAWGTAWSGSATAAERVRMLEDNVVEIEVKDCLQMAAKAASDEDLDAFIGCFAEKQRPRVRRRAAILFVRHSLDLELLDSHLVRETDQKVEVAVKYRTTMSQDSCDIVSLVGLAREDGAWRISREKVESNSAIVPRESQAGSGGQVFRFGGGGEVVLGPLEDDGLPADIGRQPGRGCANGRCGVPR